MDVLIINPPIRLHDKPRHIPHGLAILANIIRRKLGVTPTFLDINAHRYSEAEIEERIRSAGCDVALIGGLAPTYRSIVKLSGTVKSIHPNATIIAPGSRPTVDCIDRAKPARDLAASGRNSAAGRTRRAAC